MYSPSPSCQAAATAAAKAGKVTESDVLAAFERLDTYRKKLEAAGQVSGNQARIERYAADLAERTKIAAAAKKRQAALAMIVRARNRDQVRGFLKGGMSPVRALESLWTGAGGKFANIANGRVSVWARKESNRWQLIGGLLTEMQAEKPHLFKMSTDDRFDADVFTEMTELRADGKPGVTGNADAMWLAKAFAKWAEFARTRANEMGATIGKLDGWNGVQTHDADKLVRAGKDAWVGTIGNYLDMERTFPDAPGKEEAAKILGDIYDTIITGVSPSDAAAPAGYVSPANLADSLGKHRVLHFADAQAALAYRAEFGYGSTIGGMLNHLSRMSHTIGIMEGMGPNPGALFDDMVKELAEEVSRNPAYTPKQRSRYARALKTQSGVLRSAFSIGMGLHSHIGGSETFADIMGGARSIERMSKLGAATFTSVPSDTVVSAIATQFRGGSFIKGVMTHMGGMMRGKPKGEQAEIAYLTSAAWDGWINKTMQGRAAMDSPVGLIGKMEELFFRANGLTQTTDIARGVNGRAMAAEMGMRAKDDWASLNPRYRHVLGMHGLDAVKWEAIRKAALRSVDGKPYLTPDLIRHLDDAVIEPLIADRMAEMAKTASANRMPALREKAIAQARRDLELDVIRFYADEASFAVVSPDDATTKYTTFGGLQRGTMGGELARAVMQFKSTPIAFIQRPLARLFYGRRKGAGAVETAMHYGAYLAGLMIAGYMSMTAKDMLKGYWPPRDPMDPRTWGAAALQSGALGIYGDYLFSQTNRFGSGLGDTLLGPTIGSVVDLAELALAGRDYAMGIATGDEDAKFSAGKAITTIGGNIPYSNLYYVKPALDYLFVNSMREAASPGYLRNIERKRMREYGQERYGPLGPTLAGDLAR